MAPGLGTTVHEWFARFAAVLDHLRVVASSLAPLIIVLDDVHLADEATLLLARFVLREQRGLSLLLVLTRRDASEAVTSEARELLSEIERTATMILLRGLSPAAARTYLATLGLRSLAPGLLETVATITGGNPLHLRQVAARSALDGDVLAALEGREAELVSLAASIAGRTAAIAPLGASCFGKRRRVAAVIKDEWLDRAIRRPIREQLQADGRIRRWAQIPEMEGRYLRVIVLADRETIHNAFFDRGFDEDSLPAEACRSSPELYDIQCAHLSLSRSGKRLL
jgi:hypothetical protein